MSFNSWERMGKGMDERKGVVEASQCVGRMWREREERD